MTDEQALRHILGELGLTQPLAKMDQLADVVSLQAYANDEWVRGQYEHLRAVIEARFLVIRGSLESGMEPPDPVDWHGI